MAKRKVTAAPGAGRAKAETSPKFPYTTKPTSLRRLLKEIPKRPKPAKFDTDLLKSWGFTDANDYSMLRVLKTVNLLNEKNEPTELYSQWMLVPRQSVRRLNTYMPHSSRRAIHHIMRPTRPFGTCSTSIQVAATGHSINRSRHLKPLARMSPLIRLPIPLQEIRVR